MTSTKRQAPLGSAPPMSRVEWAIARYNYYRAFGLLEDAPEQTAEITRYQRSPDPPPPKPHLKWYPLSTPDDDTVTMYQRSVAATRPSEPRRRYSQRVTNAQARTMLAKYRAQKHFDLRAGTSGILFDESKHPRAAAGQPNGGQFIHGFTGAENRTSHIHDAADDESIHKSDANTDFPDLADYRSIGNSLQLPRFDQNYVGLASPPESSTENAAPDFTNHKPLLVAGIPHWMIAAELGALPAVDQLRPPVVVGHHPLPVAVLKDAWERKLISDDAVALAMETYLKDPGHGFRTYGGVTHADYNSEVKEQLENLIKNKKFSARKPVDKATMNQFLTNLVEGKGWNGEPVPAINRFNDAVLDISGKYVAKSGDVVEDIANRTAAQIDEAIERCRGRARFWTSRFTAAALAGVGSLLQNQAQAGQAALASPYLQEAIIELEKGNVDGARKKVLGEGGGPGSVMEDVSKSVGSAAAVLNTQKAFEKLFADNFDSTAERLHAAGR